MTIQTKHYRVIKLPQVRGTVQPQPVFTNRWRCQEGVLPPIYRNDELKGTKV